MSKTAIILKREDGEIRVWCGQHWGWYPLKYAYEPWHPVVVYNSREQAEAQAERLRQRSAPRLFGARIRAAVEIEVAT